jgi:hypothetical protein
MKTAEEEAREKARRQIRLRETETWTWEEISALRGDLGSGAPVIYQASEPPPRSRERTSGPGGHYLTKMTKER